MAQSLGFFGQHPRRRLGALARLTVQRGQFRGHAGQGILVVAEESVEIRRDFVIAGTVI